MTSTNDTSYMICAGVKTNVIFDDSIADKAIAAKTSLMAAHRHAGCLFSCCSPVILYRRGAGGFYGVYALPKGDIAVMREHIAEVGGLILLEKGTGVPSVVYEERMNDVESAYFSTHLQMAREVAPVRRQQ